MYQLSEDEIDLIERDLVRLGITTKSIRDNLLDHICILLEQQVIDVGQFSVVYNKVTENFYRNSIREIEVEARLSVLSKQHIILSKWQFFTALLLLVISPFSIYLLLSPSISDREVWGPAVAYATWPLCSLIIIFLIPKNLDPPIPKNSRIAVGVFPPITLISN